MKINDNNQKQISSPSFKFAVLYEYSNTFTANNSTLSTADCAVVAYKITKTLKHLQVIVLQTSYMNDFPEIFVSQFGLAHVNWKLSSINNAILASS